MTYFLPPKILADSITLYWSTPRYLPLSYQISYQCTLLSENNPYCELTEILSPSNETYKLRGLLLGSVCAVSLVAVYNPAGSDEGISTNVFTPHDSKLRMVYIQCNYIHAAAAGLYVA